MAKYSDVFERKEIKHVINATQHRQLEEALEGRMEIDAYGRSQITSIYYDTPRWEIIERSLDKPVYKEKLRVRIYGYPTDATTDEAFVEVKKKYKGIVYKRRVRMTLAAAQAYFDGVPYEDAICAYPLADPEAAAEALSFRSLQIAREIDRFREFHGPLVPSMGIAVQRSAFVPILGAVNDFATSDLRITVDEDVRYRNLVDGQADYQNLMEPGACILEIKAMGTMPLWLVRFLDGAGIFPSSFSKYGEAYIRSVQAS